MTDTKQKTVTLQCSCEKGRKFPFQVELDSAVEISPTSRTFECPYCGKRLRIAMEVDVAEMIEEQKSDAGKKGSPRRRATRNRAIPTESTEDTQ